MKAKARTKTGAKARSKASSAIKTKTAAAAESAEHRLQGFIAKFAATDQRLIRAARAALRRRLPTANELVWDNYNFFVIGYSPTERPGDSILSLAARANALGLCFVHGAALPDPHGLLQGGGRQTRFIRIDAASRLTHPHVEQLLKAAIAHAKTPFAASGRGRLIIRSVSAKQRPRQTASAASKAKRAAGRRARPGRQSMDNG